MIPIHKLKELMWQSPVFFSTLSTKVSRKLPKETHTLTDCGSLAFQKTAQRQCQEPCMVGAKAGGERKIDRQHP